MVVGNLAYGHVIWARRKRLVSPVNPFLQQIAKVESRPRESQLLPHEPSEPATASTSTPNVHLIPLATSLPPFSDDRTVRDQSAIADEAALPVAFSVRVMISPMADDAFNPDPVRTTTCVPLGSSSPATKSLRKPATAVALVGSA
jgi:hypothetical protein